MTSTTAPARSEVGRNVLDRFRDLVESGAISRAIEVDRHTGEIVDPEARALFAALPAVTPATSADELLDQGVLPHLPRDLHRAFEHPKYRVGRELLVKTKVSFEDRGQRGVGFYSENGEPAFTHRAVLKGQRKDDFLVAVEGASSPLSFPRTEIFSCNEPSALGASGGTISGVQVDYNDPLLKAHILAGYIENGAAILDLDFSKEPDVVTAAQEKLVANLAARVKMNYAGQGEGYAGHRAGALMSGGQGVCFVQRAVVGAYLQAFARVLAFQVQLAVGRTLNSDVPHGFAVITLFPSLRRYVCDPAWSEPLTDLRVAFFDARWGHDRRLVGFEGQQEITIRPFEVDLPEEEA